MRLLIYLFAFIISLCAATQKTNRVLVLYEKPDLEKTHSLFLDSLRQRGYELSLKKAGDASLALFKFGSFLYDHVIIFAPSVEKLGGTIKVEELTKFVDGGGNVLVAGDSKISDTIRRFATEVGFEYTTGDSMVIDHHNYDSRLDKNDHTTLVLPSDQLTSVELIAGDRKKLGPILYRGVALVYNENNPLRLPILSAPTTAYAFKPSAVIDEYPQAIGRQGVLIGGMQARNNARVVLTGSLAMFSNEFLNANVQRIGSSEKPQKSGNLQLIESLTKWVFKENGVLRVKSVQHTRIGEDQPPREYTITDNVKYQIEIEELREGKWQPFTAKDVQLEFVRIDPFVRTTLGNNNGRFSAQFKLPDVYGVFKFLIDYRRLGYTHLYNVQQVVVRPFEHTEYERFVHSAYPYYVSSLSMVIGVLLFSCVFLYHKEAPLGTTETKKTK